MKTKANATGVNAIKMATFPKGPTPGTTPAKVTTSSSNAPGNPPDTQPADNSRYGGSGTAKALAFARSRGNTALAAKISEASKESNQ